MVQQHLAPASLTGLAVSLGPGSFTGLRTGLSTAKGLALALKVPLVGIPTLEVTACPHMTQRLPIWAILQAGRGRICAAYYVRQRGHWRRQGAYLLTTVEALGEQVDDTPALFCGEIDAREASLIPSAPRRRGDRRHAGSHPASGGIPGRDRLGAAGQPRLRQPGDPVAHLPASGCPISDPDESIDA